MSESLSTAPTGQTYAKAEIPSATQQHQQEGHLQKTQHALEKLENDFQETTRTAVEEGKEDVHQASSTYIEQALSMADKGITGAQGYLQIGKERLTSPNTEGHQQTGFVASLTATAASALDAAHHGLGYAHQTLHNNAPHLQQHEHHPAHGPASTSVTVPTKPLGQALSDNVTTAQAAVQPHVDAAQATLQPHVDAARATVQPHVDAAVAAAQPHVDAATQAAKPYVASAVDTAQPYVNSAAETAKPYVNAAVSGAQQQVDAVKAAANSDKPYSQQASEAATSAATTVRETAANYGATDETRKTEGASI